MASADIGYVILIHHVINAFFGTKGIFFCQTKFMPEAAERAGKTFDFVFRGEGVTFPADSRRSSFMPPDNRKERNNLTANETGMILICWC